MSNRAAIQINKLVKDKGRDVVLTVETTGAYDIATSTYAKGVSSVQTVKAYTSSYQSEDMLNTSIQSGDQKTLVPNKDINGDSVVRPDTGSTLTVDGLSYRIISVQAIYEGSSPALYICQARR